MFSGRLMSKIGVFGSARMEVPLKIGGSHAEECARSPIVAPCPERDVRRQILVLACPARSSPMSRSTGIP